MGNSDPKQSFPRVAAALVVTGFGIGWLAGLSVSPVVSIVIASVTGSVATIIAALSGVKDEFIDAETSPATVRRFLRAVTPAPLAWLVAGLVVGASVGVWARTHNWLSPTPPAPPSISLQEDVAQWEALGLPREEVVRALFEQRVLTRANEIQPSGSGGVAMPGNFQASSRDSVLFAVSQDECVEITERTKSDTAANFRRYLSVKPKWQKLEEAIADDTVLREVVAALCANGG